MRTSSTAVIQAQADSESLTEDEMFGALVNLLFAGHDTTRYQFGWLIYMLLTCRDQWERLVADPGLAPGAIEESMRLTPSLRIVLRRADEDVEYRGVRFPAGIFSSSASTPSRPISTRRFSTPRRRLTSPEATPASSSFSAGGHACALDTRWPALR